MESKKRGWDQVLEKKTLTGSCYNNRKECIKKKTMELATLCGINACTIIFGADGKVESWPENKRDAKAIIKKFKDLTNNPYKRTKVRDESQKEDFMVPDGETHSWRKKPRGSNQIELVENGESVNLTEMIEKSSLGLSKSSLTEYHKFLKQLDAKLEALTERIGFLRKDQQFDTYSCSMEKKQLYYSEKTSQEKIKISQAPLFPFDLNNPPADEAENCSSLSSEDYNELHLHC